MINRIQSQLALTRTGIWFCLIMIIEIFTGIFAKLIDILINLRLGLLENLFNKNILDCVSTITIPCLILLLIFGFTTKKIWENCKSNKKIEKKTLYITSELHITSVGTISLIYSFEVEMTSNYNQFFYGTPVWMGYRSFKSRMSRIGARQSNITQILDEKFQVKLKYIQFQLVQIEQQLTKIQNTKIESPYSNQSIQIKRIIKNTFGVDFDSIHQIINKGMKFNIELFTQLENPSVIKKDIIFYCNQTKEHQAELHGWMANYNLQVSVLSAMVIDGVLYIFLFLVLMYLLMVAINSRRSCNRINYISLFCLLMIYVVIALALTFSSIINNEIVYFGKHSFQKQKQNQFLGAKFNVCHIILLDLNIKNLSILFIYGQFQQKSSITLILIIIIIQLIFEKCRNIKLTSESSCYSLSSHQSLPQQCKITPSIFSTVASLNLHIELLQNLEVKLKNQYRKFEEIIYQADRLFQKTNMDCKVWKRYYDNTIQIQNKIKKEFEKLLIGFFIHLLVLTFEIFEVKAAIQYQAVRS